MTRAEELMLRYGMNSKVRGDMRVLSPLADLVRKRQQHVTSNHWGSLLPVTSKCGSSLVNLMGSLSPMVKDSRVQI